MALFSATFGALASWLTIGAAAATIGSAATGIVTATQTGRGSTPQMPEVPKVEDATKTATEKAKSKRAAMARSQTHFTSPLGETTEAETARKTLLGQ